MLWLIAIWCVNAVVGIMLSVLLIVFRQRFSLARWLRNGDNGLASASPSVSVVIAARNEEDAVGRTLREFAALPGVSEIIIVDDGSEDNTLQIAKAIAAKDARVRVLEAPQLPQGWVGKTHALHWASKHAQSEYILFTDADVHIQNLPLQDIVCRMKENALDHVGGNFRLDLQSLSEAIVGPVFAAITFVVLGLAALRCGAGSGAFNLVCRTAYNRLNGHSAIRNRVIDDVALAQHFKRNGLRSCFVDTSSVISVRLFEGFYGLFRSLSRWSILMSHTSAFLTLTCSIVVMAINVSLVIGPAMLWTQCSTSDNWTALLGTTLLTFFSAYFFSVIPFVLVGPLHSRHSCWGFVSPIGALTMAGAVAVVSVRSLVTNDIRWRGRSYPRPNCSNGRNTY